ncbi:MAG: thiamine ABC transporter substrate-binding protein [Dehalococcoidia bacterium]
MRARTVIAAFAVMVASAWLLVACGDDGGPKTLTVLTHDSFDAMEEVIAAFEQEHNVTVTIVKGGDANQVVNRAILNAGNPEADVLFGVDNLAFRRAVEADVFDGYKAKRRGDIPASILAQFGDSDAVTPIDFGYVNINADRAAGDPPSTFEELTTEQWRGKLVVEDPATSSPGLQFLASTVAYFGEGGWQDFWRALRENDVLITDGWEDAYYTHFSRWGGDRPLVVSYTTSPAAEVFFADPPVDEPPTLNVIPGPLFRQVEAAGVLKGADEKKLARAFIDFMLSDAFQQQIPETMFVYPVIPGVETPDWWQWAEVDVEAASLDVDQAEIDRWIREWTEIMRR